MVDAPPEGIAVGLTPTGGEPEYSSAIAIAFGVFVNFLLAVNFHVTREEAELERWRLGEHQGWPNRPPRSGDAEEATCTATMVCPQQLTTSAKIINFASGQIVSQ